MSQTTLPDILQKTTPLDESLAALTNEASDFLQELKRASLVVTKLEENLKALQLNFPFRLEVENEKTEPYELREYHKRTYSDALRYYYATRCFLAWEADDNSKTYRLFVIVEKQEIVDCGDTEYVYQRERIFKKAFSETPLKDMRLQYMKYLLPFVDAFKKELENHKKDIRLHLLLELPF